MAPSSRLNPMLNKILQSRWFTAAAVVIIGFFLISLIKIQPVLTTTQKELNNLDKKIAEAEQSASELERLKDYLQSSAYLEKQARLKLNYKKPDENVVYIYTRENSNKTETKNAGENGAVESKLSQNLKLWWRYITE